MPRSKKAAIAAMVLISLASGRYIIQTMDGDIQPTLTTWLLFAVAVSLSMWTYRSTEQRDLLANVGNLMDVICCWVELFAIVFLSPHPRLGLNGFEVLCILAAIGIGIVWRRTKQHVAANFALQGIMIVAYLPTLYGLWNASTNHESLSAWGIMWFAGVLTLIPAIANRNLLAIVYASRSFAFITLLLYLMIRIQLR